MKIAILGWGSLLWEENREFDARHEPWKYDGPRLKIEFSRVSTSRQGSLTLVIDEEHGSPTAVAWCFSKRQSLEDAICDLRCREGTTVKNIGCVIVSDRPDPPAAQESIQAITDWAREKARETKLDAVIWTALKSNFKCETKTPFSVGNAVAYVKTLDPCAKAKAAEYVWRAKEFVWTPVRTALQQEPWFSEVKPPA